ncbi:hypothetical protein BCR42DRAFT_91815 [Absidia repens]|uniref:Ankyrin repeat-containing domain protein n=1 Tax=Absidia repens TaxID=90262 RepID=A0A1X2IYV3_9FUNG|nr:hypothetical protein BCR42DRAFT_91815 [Absidia repens]
MNSSKKDELYHSPTKLWRQLQTIIRTNNDQDFERLCGDDYAPHVARALLSHCLPNDATMASASNKYRILQLNITTQLQHDAQQLFGGSGRDLNALQMALFLQHETIARSILAFLQHYASPADLEHFVNHTWGHGNSSLHLASFLGMENLVRLLLECGADTTHRNTRQYGPLDGCTKSVCIQLLQPFYSPASTTIKHQQRPLTTFKESPTSSPLVRNDLPQSSILLKKAVQRSMVTLSKNDSLAKPPLHFSTSTSSNSSYSSLSSLNEPLSPSPSNQMTSYYGAQRYWISPPPTPSSPKPPKSHSPQYAYHDDDGTITRRIKMLPNLQNHMNQPTLNSYQNLRSPLPSPPPSVSYDQDVDENSDGNTTTVFSATNSKTHCRTSTIRSSSASPRHRPKSVRFSPEWILLDACMRGDIEDLMDLIRQQQRQSQPVSVLLQEWQDRQTTPIISLALLYQQEPMAKCLLSLGADVNATDPDGWAPLHYAATLHLWSTLVELAHHPGVCLDARTKNGLRVYDCPHAMADRRRCKTLIDRAKKRWQ